MVTNNFSKSSLDLNGKVSLNMPTALDWGEDGRLYVTEVSGEVKVLTVAFGDPTPNDGDSTASFYVTEAETISLIKSIPNHNDDGSASSTSSREVTGIDVTPQYDENGAPVIINGKPAVNVYVTSSDSRIGAGNGGEDTGLDTNSGIITRLTQTESGWEAVDLVRGLARSEENHALNGLEVIQELDANGHLVSERIIVANGGNANAGAPSNNFSGQQETAYSAAILEIDLDQLNAMEVKSDNGRDYIYDVPTLDDPTRTGEADANDPFGGNDGFNGGKIDPDGPVQIYSPGYRNAYDVEVTEDGRVWTYDNGANNSWGGRPVGEAGDNGATTDYAQDADYIATNLNNGDGNSSDFNLESGWDPKNYDQFHEITRSDDLAGRILSAGQGGAATYTMTHPDFDEPLTLVYGGHPNPTRASGGEAGLLFTPKDGVEDAFLLVSGDHYDAVIDWFTTVESESGGAAAGELTSRVISVVPGELYYITEDGNAYLVSENPGSPSSIQGSSVLGEAGIPADFDEVVAALNPIEGNYLEGGYTDGSLDTGLGSINGLTEYTSTVFDDGDTKMSGAILASQYNGGDLIVMGRDENGVMQTTSGSGATKAADRITLELTGSPLGLTSIGDDLSAWDNQSAFRGSVWASVYSGSGTKVEILQPNNGAVPLAGAEVSDSTDHDLDGVDNIHDPFEYSATNGLELTPDKAVTLDFQPTEAPYPGTLADTGLMGAALDGSTPNQDANPDQDIPGLFDNGGNIIPGANAPIFQIKNVVPGSVVGSENGVRDAMQVGVKPSDDVQRLVATTEVQNWIPTADGVQDGQLTGIMFGDGTQANFVRFVFGEVNGEPGFEVGYEIGDSNYQALAQVALPALAASGTTEIELRLEIDMANGFALHAAYRLNDQEEFTDLPLGGFTLPEGVLQDVLTGSHTISDGDTQLSSGAAFGFLAETSEGAPLAPVNFNNLHINGFGNEMADATPPEVVSITLDQPLDNDSPILATVVVTDNAGIDVQSITGDELIFTGYSPGDVSLATGSDAIALSDDGKTATIQYLVSPPSDSNAWSSGSFEVGVADGSYTDTAGLGVAAYETDAFIVTNLDSLVKGALQRAINVGSTSDTIDNGLEGDDKHTYGGAISDDPILGIDLEADNPDYYSTTTKTDANIDGKAGTTGSNSGGIDLDGSAYHTYRDSSAGSYTATYDVPNGVYVVELHFAELYQSQAGLRQGDYTIQGEILAENFDAFTQAGGADKPVVLTKNVIVTDGKIVVGVHADTGEPGFNAIAIYQAVDGDVPVASILSIDAPESSEGQVVVSVRYTDDDAIAQAQIDVDDVTVSSSAGGAPVSPSQVSYDSASGVATYTFDAPDGGWQTGTLTATVGANAVLDGDDNGNGATASSVYASYSSEGVILALDFENPGSPLEEGGFDGTLGNVSDDSVVTTVEDGELIVWTSNGDMSQAANPSANDFIKHVALGSESLNEINISSRFDNPFPEALAAQGLDTTTVPNYAQQGIVFGLGNQNHNQLLKLVFGGNGGTVIQLWSKGSIDTKISLEDMLSDDSKGLTDIAKVELTLSIDKAAGTVTPIATLFDANDNVLGGLRAEPTEGFATAVAETLPAAVLANLTDPDGETAVGVTSTDYGNPVGSFKASWDHLSVTSPDLSEQPDSQITLAIADAEPVVESGDDGTSLLSFGLSASEGFSGEIDLEFTIDGAAETRTVSFDDGVGALTVEVANDDQDNGPEGVTIALTGVDDTAFTIDAGSATAAGSVTEDDSDMDASTLSLEFNDGDTLEALFDGVTDGSGTSAEETGTATITGGNLIIATTDGDAGGGNNANDNYYTNVSGGDGFSASLKFGNPFPTLPAQYSQLGMNVSLSQNEYLKVTFGNTGGGQQVEYSYENGGVQTKQTFGLPSGVSIAQIADVVITLDASVANDVATFSGSMAFLDASGQALGSTALPALALPDGPLNTAIVTEGATFGVGVTQTSIGSGPNFDASYDYLRIQPNGEEAPSDPVSEEDIDGDGIANQDDNDIDGDGVNNGDDVFAYDAEDGQPLADGDTLRLDFNVDGTPYQNGFTGVMASSNPAFAEEDTGAGVVENGQLRVTTTGGDTGSANTPQNDYHLGIVRQGGFVVETVVDNPFTTTPGSYSQLGIAVSVNSDDFVKLVFGSVGQDIEFSTRDSNVETKLGADFPGGYDFADFAKAKLAMEVVVDSSGNATANATITLLDSAGAALPNDASVTINGLDLTGSLEQAIIDPAASVGVGVTHTHGSATPFTAAYDYLEVTATEVDDDTDIPPVPATQVEEIFAASNLDLGDTYGQGDIGSALVTVTPGNDNVQLSNYGSDSFKVQNTGDKKIAAVFFDVTTALYGDSVFDPDGKGGDATFKEWAINSDGNTGAIQPSGYEHYFLPGTDPDPSNPNDNGGFRGALVKFSATDDGGFTNGEVVGFSGDMDPNSIAGFNKGGAAGVDTGSVPAWDVGGVSGAELIGSNVYIKFTDGSTASGQLMSDGSQAGAQVQITEASPNLTAELSVNGVSSGGQGTYGGEVPSVIVSGPAGEWVRVVMTKGHQPVANDQNGIADTVEDRLADNDFPANNAAEFQIVDVQLDASGTADVSQEFSYGDFLNGTSSFEGDDTLPLGFVASVIDNPNTSEGLALGPVSQPIYMISNGTAVDGSAAVDTELFVDDSIDDQSEPENGFVAVVEQASDDVEQGFSASSSDLEIGSYVVGLQFTIPDNVNLDNGDTIDSAVINWVSDRTHSANTTMTFSVENTLNGDGFGSVTDRNYLEEEEVWQASGTWQDGENITAGVDLADQINSLVAQDGLDAGDVITIKIEGVGGTRYIEAAGGDRTAPTLSITMADSSDIGASNNAANSEVDAMDIALTSDEVGLLGVNDTMEVGIL